MNWADYVIIAILALSVLIGLARGLISEVLSLLLWVGAFWMAWTFGPSMAHHFEGTVSMPSVRVAIGYGVVFGAVMLVGGVFRWLISRLIHSTGLGGPDRLFGMAFGLGRGVLIVSGLVFLLQLTPLPADTWWRQSVMLPQFEGPAAWLGQQIPPGVRDYMHPPEALKELKLPDMQLPSKDDLMKLRDFSLPGPSRGQPVTPAAPSSAASL